MAFESLHAFFAMGGHGAYVWSAWAVAALAMTGSAVHARAEHRRLVRDLKRRARRDTPLPRTDRDAP